MAGTGACAYAGVLADGGSLGHDAGGSSDHEIFQIAQSGPAKLRSNHVRKSYRPCKRIIALSGFSQCKVPYGAERGVGEQVISATFVLPMLTLGGEMNPSKKSRAFWGIAEGTLTIVMLVVGGEATLKVLQTASVASAFPFMFVLLGMCVGVRKAMKDEFEPTPEAKADSDNLPADAALWPA